LHEEKQIENLNTYKNVLEKQNVFKKKTYYSYIKKRIIYIYRFLKAKKFTRININPFKRCLKVCFK